MIANTVKNDIQLIPLKNLFLSEHNVRTVLTTKEEDKTLKASIAANGLVQNLVVHKKGNKYGVFAGGRRFNQLKKLNKEKAISSDYLVPCSIKSENEITALSLAENVARVKMHPADEFMAFNKLIEQGRTIQEVAHQFGTTQINVKKRMKLACLCPDIIEYFKAGKLTLDQVIAFTLSLDHDKQVAVYKELAPNNLSAFRIKSMLTEDKIKDDHDLMQLVTKKVYKKAGGTVTDDIFDNVAYVNDVELLTELAKKILSDEAERLLADGWKWAENLLDYYQTVEHQTTLSAELKNVPVALTKKLKDLEKEGNELQLIDFDDWTEVNETRETEIEEEIEKLEEEREQYRNFSKKQKVVSGVVVTHNNGVLKIEYGLVKKEDMAAAFPPDDTKQVAGVSTDNEMAASGGVESQALKGDLHNFKLQAVQSEIMKDDKLTYDLMVYTLALQFAGSTPYCDKPSNASIEASNTGTPDGIDETSCKESIRQFYASLNVAWYEQKGQAAKFAAFRDLSSIQKKHWLSYCTALSYLPHTNINAVVKKTINFDMSHHWKATKENYFKRIKTADLLSIGAKQISEQWAIDHAKMSKGQLIDLLDGHDSMVDWMPESMK